MAIVFYSLLSFPTVKAGSSGNQCFCLAWPSLDMLHRCHSFYQKLFFPPPWVEWPPWEYQGRSAGDQPSQYNTTTISTASTYIVNLKEPKLSSVQIKGKHSCFHLLFYIHLRYKKIKSGQYILSFQLKLICLSHNNDLSKVIIFRTEHVIYIAKADFADTVKSMILIGSGIQDPVGWVQSTKRVL